VPCTKCGYCLPCPSEVNIPACFEIFNGAFLHGDVEGAKTFYRMFLRDGIRGMNASACLGCRDCESRCPQHIDISSWMPKVHSMLGAPQAAA
jgi:predicted aldo/keto reductase-like oxidoreductase